ncbi:hypothetical protein LTR37_003962 [Vermiconidia calcicola]|uniref:Uncharacterized protein n=1 Tax=Vermiconidia calcicola TaxID=1690605 RepID=A0ACC3NND4_9PEZI|nr:hypothetical protein LTR37_003962 [Vermiconidia calcicola]
MASTGDEGSDPEPLDFFTGNTGSAPVYEHVGSSIEVPNDSQPATASQEGQSSPTNSDEEEGGEDSDRENRFIGPDSTWRTHTAAERSLLASLEQQRANDLSIHLYNAHALKARIQDPNAAASKRKSYRGKKHWIKPNEDGSLPWHPDAAWTAWPLRPEAVPRKGEVFGRPVLGEDDGTYRRKENWRPSGDLEEEVLAVMLRRAKEQFRGRQRKGLSTVAKLDDGVARPSRKGKGASEASGADADTDETMRDKDTDTESGESHSELEDLLTSHCVKPDIMADDDEAALILQPTVRHILSELDRLLIGLHTSRQGHVNRINDRSTSRSKSKTQSGRSRSRSKVNGASSKGKKRSKRAVKAADDDSDDGDSEEESRAPSKADSQAASQRRRSRENHPDLSEEAGEQDPALAPKVNALTSKAKRHADRAKRRSDDEHAEDDASADDTTPEGEDDDAKRDGAETGTPDNIRDQPENERKNPKRQRPLNPRDWSEVLGIASLVGWNSAAVDRAARRCTSLFGERMDFQAVSGTAMQSHTVGERQTVLVKDEPRKDWFSCPVPTCLRHGEPYEKTWRWREHLKRSHKFSNARVTRMETSLRDQTGNQGSPNGGKDMGVTIADDEVHGVDDETNSGDDEMNENDALQGDTALPPGTVKMRRRKMKGVRSRKTSKRRRIDEDDDEASREA